MKEYRVKDANYLEYFGSNVDLDTVITDEDVEGFIGALDSMEEAEEKRAELYGMLEEV